MKNQTFKLIYLLLFISFFLQKTKAQQPTNAATEPTFKHAIGGGAGYTTGYGLSYRFTPNRFGVQVNFAPFNDKELKRYSFGVTFMYTMIKNKFSSLYLYQGNHYYYNSEFIQVFEYDTNKPFNPNPPKQWVTNSYINNSVGFGIEAIIAKQIGLNLMTGYAFYHNFEQLNITGEVALYYKF